MPALFIAVLELSLAGLLVARRRCEAENLLLAGFLVLLSLSFVAKAVYLITGIHAWIQVGYVAGAFDALLFLAFATGHPYVRRTRLHRIALGWLALAGLTSAILTVADPAGIIFGEAPPLAPARLLLLVGIWGFGYTLSWFASVAALRDAPTDGLAKRARWSCLAIGVGVVPRIPLIPFLELQLLPSGPGVSSYLLHLLALLAVVALLVVPAYGMLRGAREGHASRRTAMAVGAVSTLLLVLFTTLGFFRIPFNDPFALRWTVFSGILVFAILAHQVIQFHDSARRILPLVGAAVLGLVAAFVAAAWASAASVGPWAVAASAGVAGLAAAMPGARAASAFVAWAERAPGASNQAERRLVLYSAAVESAVAGGTSGRLPTVRRHLGLSRDEARVVEDLVRRSFQQRPQALAQPLQPGDEPLPGIVVERRLRGGSQAHAFLASRLPGHQPVVVKQLPPSIDAVARRQLWRELDALRSLAHPSLPRLLGFALDPVPCVAYDYVPGRTLAQALRRGLAVRRMAPFVADLLSALGAVHSSGFAHGDVKPSNIILGRDGRAHLIDFGTAEARPAPRATLAGEAQPSPAGTLEYMAPEQARKGRPSPAADVFSLGVVVLEAVTGRPGRRLDGLAVYQALDLIAREPVPFGHAPPPWHPFLEAALRPDPRHRGSLGRLTPLLPASSKRPPYALKTRLVRPTVTTSPDSNGAVPPAASRSQFSQVPLRLPGRSRSRKPFAVRSTEEFSPDA